MKNKTYRFAVAAALLLALALVFVAPVSAGEETVEAGGVLAQAIIDAGPGGTVTLNGDVTVSEGITLSHDVTLNLGGNQITYTGIGPLFTVNAGNLTINANENGGIESTACIVSINTESPASLTVVGGKYETSVNALRVFLIALDNDQDKESKIKDAKISGYTQAIQVSGYANVVVENCDITVIKSEYTSGDYYCHGIMATYGGTVYVKGGSVTSDGVALASWYTNGKITVEDATITGTAAALQAMPAETATYAYQDGESVVTVISGTVTGPITKDPVYIDANKLAYSSGGNGATININGGTFIVKDEAGLKAVLSYIADDGNEDTIPTIQLENDIQVTDDTHLNIPASVKIEGMNKKLWTNSHNRFLRIGHNAASNHEKITVLFKDITIENTKTAGRCIETRTGNVDVTVRDSSLIAEKGQSQPFTVGGTGTGISVTIINTNIKAGDGGYGITTFNPVILSISAGSEISGYSALYFKGDGTDADDTSTVTVENSKLIGNGDNDVVNNSFGTITFGADPNDASGEPVSCISVTIENSKVTADDVAQSLFRFGTENYENYASSCSVTVSGDSELTLTNGANFQTLMDNGGGNSITIENGVTSNFQIESKYFAEDKLVCLGPVDGKYTVTEKSYELTATEKVSFSTVKVGYTQPEPQTVTVTNNCNVPVKLEQPTSTNYVIGILSATELAAGDKATFTIQPKAELAVGNYAETISIKTNTSASASVAVSFIVDKKTTTTTTTKPTPKPEEPVEPETPVEEPEVGEATVETEVTDGGEVELETPSTGGSAAADEDEAKITGVVLPTGTDSEVTFIPISKQAAPEGKETQTKKVFEINVPTYEKGKPATIKFTMTVAELEADGKTASEVALWHFDEETGEWTKLLTSYTIVDGIVYFEAITYDFSPFAIIYEETPVEEPVEEPETPATPAPILAVLAGLGAAVVLRRK